MGVKAAAQNSYLNQIIFIFKDSTLLMFISQLHTYGRLISVMLITIMSSIPAQANDFKPFLTHSDYITNDYT